MKVQFAAWLLCLVVIVGTVDSVPDIPALTRNSGERIALSHIHQPGPVPAKHALTASTLGLAASRSVFCSYWRASEQTDCSYTPLLLSFASDTSPPVLFRKHIA